MKYSEVLRYRDRAIETEVLNIFPQNARDAIRTQLHNAILKAATDWEREYLPSLIGEKAAKEFSERLKTEQVS